MNYLYHCDRCSDSVTISKDIHDSGRLEYCGRCCELMDRIYTVPHISVSHIEPHFNHGLGCEIRSKAQMRNRMREIEGNTGCELVEMGSDDYPVGHAPERKEY